MPRTPAYDYQRTLDQAMEVFWRRGYHATSIRDLVAATGLQPGSLYAAFGGKRQLFERILDHYHEANVAQIRAQLKAGGPPLQRIRAVFDRLLKRCREDREGRGCLINTVLELSWVDPELARRANRMFQDIERELVPVIAEAQERGDIPPHRDCRSLARYLIMCIHGIRVYSRGRLDPAGLPALVDQALDSLVRQPGRTEAH